MVDIFTTLEQTFVVLIGILITNIVMICILNMIKDKMKDRRK